MPPQKNHFSTLGVEIGAGEDEIKKAYRKLAKQWHPDKNRQPGAEDKFKEINASYEFLSSIDRREIHERDLKHPKPKPPPRPPPPSSNPSQPSPSSNPSQPSQSYQSYSSPKGSSSYANSKSNNNSTGKTNTSGDNKPKRPPSAKQSKGTKKPNAASWSETFTKNFGQTKTQKEDPHGKRDSYSYSSKHDDDDVFSFPFEFFEDKKPPFDREDTEDIINSFFKPTDAFEDDFFWTMNFGAGFSPPPKSPSKPKYRPRNVAPESGNAMGLDDEYLFTSRSGGRPPSGREIKEACPWCGKIFPIGQLDQHEDKCGKFDVTDDENYDEDSDLDDLGSYFAEQNSDRRPSWQKQHDDHMNKVRRDKMRYKDRVGSHGERNSGFVLCPYCERSFNENAAGRHISFCRERLKTFGKPLNTKQSEPRTSKAEDQANHNNARSRSYKYAKGIPKPTIPNPFFKPSNSRVPEDGNDHKFPHPRTETNTDDLFGVNGHGFSRGPAAASGPGNSYSKFESHPRPQERSSYADIHKPATRQAPPRNAFSNRTNLDGATGRRKPNIRTGYSSKKL